MEQNCGWKYTGNEYVASLGFSVLKRLSDILDTVNHKSNWPWWKELAGHIPGVTYNGNEINRMGTSCRDGNAAYSFLMDLSNRSVQLDQLVSGLKAIEMNKALNELGYQEKVKIVEQPQSSVTAEGGTVTLRCLAAGFPPPTYQWFKERDEIPGETNLELTMDRICLDQSGKYICRAVNKFGVDFTKWVEVKVSQPLQSLRVLQPRPSQCRSSLAITQQLPSEVSVELGRELHLQVKVVGGANLQYDWYRDGQEVAVTTTGVYHVERVTEFHQGVYMCSIHNETDSALSMESVVTIAHPAVASGHFPPANYHDDVISSLSAEHITQYYPDHNPPSSSYQLPPEGHHDSSMIMMNGNGARWPPNKPLFATKKHLEFGASPTPEQIGSPDHLRMYHRDNYHGSQETQQQQRYHHESNHSADIHDQPSGQPTPLLESSPIPVDLSMPCADKVALLIGNKQYREREMPLLRTPEMDTQDLAGALLSLNFKVVSLVNLTKAEMDQALNFFLSLLGANVYALFFFAGHGFQSGDQNYLMGVDSTLAKDPRYCLCAQDVRAKMQHQGAKVSIMLLDMCRVAASTQLGYSIYPPQVSVVGSHHYNSYFVMGFACSNNGEAYEAKNPEIRNSYFITSIINALNKNTFDEKEKIDIFLNKVCEDVRSNRPGDMDSTAAWQKPEIQSNLGEPLSLFDEIQPMESSDDRMRKGKAEAWKFAHTVSNPIVLHTQDCQVVLRLTFAAEHSNVLIIMVENLNSCSSSTTLHNINVELRSVCAAQAEASNVAVPSHQYHDEEMAYNYAKEQGKNNLTHFRITQLQKLRHPVLLQVAVNYTYEVGSNRRTERVEQVISHELEYAPLYARTVNTMTQL